MEKDEGLESQKKPRRLESRIGLSVVLGLALVGSAACGGEPPLPPAPISAAAPVAATVTLPTATATAIKVATSTAVPTVTLPAPTSTTIATATPTMSPTLEPTATLTPTVEPTATLTPTMEPTATPTVTSTVEPTPTVTATVAIVEPTASAAPLPDPTTAPPVDAALAAELQRILDGIVAGGYIPGGVLAVSIPGQETWLGASGFIDRQRTQAMTPDTRVRIASISKIFTAVVVLQLVEEGRVDLDAPINTWLPDLTPHGDRITVRHLLQHTSGLYDYLEDRTFREPAYGSPERAWNPRELVGYAARFRPAFQPGAPNAFDYSSTNYVILGMLVEQVTGRPLAQEMRQRIFEPLALRATFFAPDEPVTGHQAHGHMAGRDLPHVGLSFAFATANMVSTVDDVQRFMRALYGGELLRAETLQAMYTFVNGKGQYKMPALEYGLGLMRNRLPVGPAANGQARAPELSTVVGHTGGFAGFRTVVWWAPESGITIALGLNQSDTDPNILATQVFDAILRHQGR